MKGGFFASAMTARLASVTMTVLLWANVPFMTAAQIDFGPAFSRFRLTLADGERTEAAGPLFYADEIGDQSRWAIPPLISHTTDRGVDSEEWDFLYPILTYDRFGAQYRFQIFQLFNFAGGADQNETNRHRFSLFPIYLQQRSPDGSKNYTSFLPFYGNLENRFFRDEVRYVLFPLWLQSRKKDVVTDNYLFPLFHLRHGDGLQGWQLFPLAGRETKVPTQTTNHWGDVIPVPGHDKKFAFWPLFLDQRTGIGGTNTAHSQAVLPLYSFTRSPLRDETAVPFLLGWSSVEDREKQYHETGAPWPLIVFRRGPHTHINRVWPFYSHGTNETLETTWIAWPFYKVNRVRSEPLDRERTRILFFLYSDTIERNTESGTCLRRRDCWPLFLCRRDRNGNERLQVLALLEPFLPNAKSIERDYSHVWSLWRSEKNPTTRAASQSLLWNLYRRETRAETTHASFFFGLIQTRKDAEKTSWRFFGRPAGD
jgi:hypothetical protein